MFACVKYIFSKEVTLLEYIWNLNIHFCFIDFEPCNRGFDDEMRVAVAKNLENRGVVLHPSTNIVKVMQSYHTS